VRTVGENCTGCGRWRPSFARVCVSCNLPSPRRQVENLLAFLNGERGNTRPESRTSETYHGTPKQRPVAPKRRVPQRDPKEPLKHNVRAIRERLAAGTPAAHVAKELGISAATMSRIKKRFLHGKTSSE
jgi:hypothetical protein